MNLRRNVKVLLKKKNSINDYLNKNNLKKFKKENKI